jgi:hypothetical protein
MVTSHISLTRSGRSVVELIRDSIRDGFSRRKSKALVPGESLISWFVASFSLRVVQRLTIPIGFGPLSLAMLKLLRIH